MRIPTFLTAAIVAFAAIAGALSGNTYDFSIDADKAKALADLVRALGGSVTNDVPAEAVE